jgi:hypothetical protein
VGQAQYVESKLLTHPVSLLYLMSQASRCDIFFGQTGPTAIGCRC